jgi:hypothetical protein
MMYRIEQEHLHRLAYAAQLAATKLAILNMGGAEITPVLGTTGLHVSLILCGDDPEKVWSAFLLASDQKYRCWVQDGRFDALHEEGNLLVSCSISPIPVWLLEWVPASVVLPQAVKRDQEVEL